MKNGLFHKSLGFPVGALQPWLGVIAIQHTSHSAAQCFRPECRRWVKGGVINIPDGESLDVQAEDIIEIEVSDGKPVKALVRLQYDDHSDVCFALLAPVAGRSLCKTLWTLDAKDHHRTLDVSKYVCPE
jgi:hypothetical protein